MIRKFFLLLLLLSFVSSSCSTQATATPDLLLDEGTETPTEIVILGDVIYTDASQPVEARVEDLLKRMSLDEKIGQMTQVAKYAIEANPSDIKKYNIGSILSGGGDIPSDFSPKGWYAFINGLQDQSMSTRLQIPLIYGIDAVHGHGNMPNATIFPHNIGLGAANDPELTEKIARATAEEMMASGIPWDFSPVVAVTQDVRWGRTYESYGEDTELVSSLGTAYVKGMQSLQERDASSQNQSLFVLSTPKHFIGDGATIWASSRQNIMNTNYMLDQGNMQVPEEVVRKLYLPPYQNAVDVGAMSVMASFSSWRGTKMHAQQYWMTKVLKNELGFNGFIVSDWQGIDQIYPDDYYASVITAINAGIDMSMVPEDYVGFIDTMHEAVNNGDIPEARIDDAVRRILRVKFSLGLFEHPMPDPRYQDTVRSSSHLELARQAVRESLVLLTNQNNILPLSKNTPVIFVAGEGANDIGLQTGGWTITWQGQTGNNEDGTTILSGIRSVVDPATQLEYNRDGDFSEFKNEDDIPLIADVGIVVLAEQPYAEGVGDRVDISLTDSEIELISLARKQSKTLIVLLLSGRPRVITDQLPLADAWVAAWLPGTEGGGIADVLFGDFPFTGKLSYTWPRFNRQLPININNSAGKTGCDAPLFPFGYGLTIGETTPEILECN